MSKPLWTNDHKSWYRSVYLQSDHWKELRARKLASKANCEDCGGRACDVHHIRYKQLFDVALTDLKSLCRPCHKRHHKKHGKPRRRKSFYSGIGKHPKRLNTPRQRAAAYKKVIDDRLKLLRRRDKLS